MAKEVLISELTVGELQKVIKQTVQEAMAEVLIEFTIAAELDAEVTYRAEMADCLRSHLQDKPFGGFLEFEDALELDD